MNQIVSAPALFDRLCRCEFGKLHAKLDQFYCEKSMGFKPLGPARDPAIRMPRASSRLTTLFAVFPVATMTRISLLVDISSSSS